MTDPRFTHDVAHAAAQIRGGELVAFPTETVYGLGADATNEIAIRKIFAAKGRPADHPLIAHFESIPAAQKWALAWEKIFDALANSFWPGPMTLIVPAAAHVTRLVTGGQDSVGIRVPSHPVARALLTQSGVPIAAPSANKFGHISPTAPQHVASEFSSNELGTILIDGECEVGVESTIIDCTRVATHGRVRILRPGRITLTDIARVIGTNALARADQPDAPRVSGSLASHYAPRTRTLLKPRSTFTTPLSAERVHARIGTLTFTVTPTFHGEHITHMQHAPARIEHDLYADLRALDALNLDEIWIESPPEGEAWSAVRDRVQRASAQ